MNRTHTALTLAAVNTLDESLRLARQAAAAVAFALEGAANDQDRAHERDALSGLADLLAGAVRNIAIAERALETGERCGGVQ